MRITLLSLALCGLSLAAPRPAPQEIDFAVVDAAADPVIVTAALAVVSQSATVLAESAVASLAAAEISTAPVTTSTATTSDDSDLARRDTACAAQAVGAGPVPAPDTASAFLAYAPFAAAATNAITPNGYSSVFVDYNASVSASNYMGLYSLTSYDVLSCASICDQVSGCAAFNIYAERDPTVAPGTNCQNPASTTAYRCTVWGAPFSASQATNSGQWRAQFQVVIAGSNGYLKAAAPAAISGFSGPTELGGAINAPSGYMGVKYYPFSQSQGYTPSTCSAACLAQNVYNKAYPKSDGTYNTCRFFVAYVLSNDSIPLGLYCTMYTSSWSRAYAVNYGSYYDNDRFTVSQAYSYTLNSNTTSSR